MILEKFGDFWKFKDFRKFEAAILYIINSDNFVNFRFHQIRWGFVDF